VPRIWIALFLGVVAMAPGHAFAQPNQHCRAQYLEQVLQSGQVPNLTRCRPDDVRKSLKAYNYDLEIENRIPNNIPAGRIVSQQVGDDVVAVVVSTGPAYQPNHGDDPYEQPQHNGGGGHGGGLFKEIVKSVLPVILTPNQQPPYQPPPYQEPPYQEPTYQPPVSPQPPAPQPAPPVAVPPTPVATPVPAPQPAPVSPKPVEVAKATPPAAPVTPPPKQPEPTPKPPKQLAQATTPAPKPKPVTETPPEPAPEIKSAVVTPPQNPPVVVPEQTPPPPAAVPPPPQTQFVIEGKPSVGDGKQFAFTIRRENGDRAGHVLQLDYSDPSLLVAPPSQFVFGPNLPDKVALRLQAATRARGAGDRNLTVTVTSGDQAEIAQPNSVTAVILGRPSWWDLIRAALSSPAALIAAAAAAAVAGAASLYLWPRATCSLGTPSVDLGPIPLRNDWPSLHVDTILGSASFSIPHPLPIGRRTDAHQPVSA
jgi:hypothetical protein